MKDRASVDLMGLLEPASSAAELLKFWARRAEGALAYTFLKDGETEDATLTFGSLDRRARAVATWLQQQGATGERALLLYPPGLEFLVAFWGCLYAGVVAVPLYPPRPNRRDARIVEITADADARFALTSTESMSAAARAMEHSPELKALLWCATDALPDPHSENVRSASPGADDLAYLQYTSGSTRSPKGAMVTHGNVIGQLRDIELAVRHPRDSVFVTWLPHFHDMGLVYGLLTSVGLGFPCYVMPPAAFLQRPIRWLTTISRYRGTHSGAPNFAYDLCAERVTDAQKCELDLTCWKVAFSGAEPVRATTVERFASAFASCGLSRRSLSPAYGLAEATLKVTVEPPGSEPRYLRIRAGELARHRVVPAKDDDDDVRTLVGCGSAVTTEIAIVNPDTLVACRPDEVGEIWLRGPSIAQGYWRRPDESERTFAASPAGTSGKRYLRTGDLGFLHEGDLYVTGRHKDLVIIRGRNHYPQDIEFTVQSCHPAFQSGTAAAVAVDFDEEEHLVVIQELDRHYRDLDLDETAALVLRRLADEHELRPYALLFVKQNAVPKTSSGKVRRQACRQAYLDRALPVVGQWTEVLPATPDTTAGSALRQQPRTADEIELFLCERLSARLGIDADQIDVQQPFSGLGLDSLKAVEFMTELEGWLGQTLSPTVFWNYPTIAELAASLAGSPNDLGNPSPEGESIPVSAAESVRD